MAWWVSSESSDSSIHWSKLCKTMSNSLIKAEISSLISLGSLPERICSLKVSNLERNWRSLSNAALLFKPHLYSRPLAVRVLGLVLLESTIMSAFVIDEISSIFGRKDTLSGKITDELTSVFVESTISSWAGLEVCFFALFSMRNSSGLDTKVSPSPVSSCLSSNFAESMVKFLGVNTIR